MEEYTKIRDFDQQNTKMINFGQETPEETRHILSEKQSLKTARMLNETQRILSEKQSLGDKDFADAVAGIPAAEETGLAK